MILKIHLSVQVLGAALLTVVFRFVNKLLGRAKDQGPKITLYVLHTHSAKTQSWLKHIFQLLFCVLFCMTLHISMFRCRKVGEEITALNYGLWS